MKDSCSLYSKGTRFATEFPCPRGYYNPDPMTQSLDSCLPCPPGHYCGKENLTAASGKCDAGESGSIWLLYCAALEGSMFGRLMLISFSFYHSLSSLNWALCPSSKNAELKVLRSIIFADVVLHRSIIAGTIAWKIMPWWS